MMTAYVKLRTELRNTFAERVREVRNTDAISLYDAKRDIRRRDKLALVQHMRRDLGRYNNAALTLSYLLELLEEETAR